MSKIKLLLMLVAALLVILSMLSLGIWQLDRAVQKKALISQIKSRAQQPIVPLSALQDQLSMDQPELSSLRFRKVFAEGVYLHEASIFIDNHVFNGQAGYQVFSPLQLTSPESVILVNRGWIPIGVSRDTLPEIKTGLESVRIQGRLNLPPPQPPFWSKKYSVSQGAVWAYLPLDQYADQLQLKVLPIVLELAPEQDTDTRLTVVWNNIDDKGVARHHGYAFQWFAMAVTFFIACLILLIRRFGKFSDQI